MIAAWMLFVPGLMAALNRYWRGEGRVTRLAWLAFNFFLALFISLNFYFAAAWLIFEIGYAVPAWHAMFSATHGKAPTRSDSRYNQWMQPAAKWLVKKIDKINESSWNFWFRFGIFYGFLRGLFMLPGIFILRAVIDSPIAMIGLVFLGMGQIYYWGGKLSRRYATSDNAVAFSEVMMGWLCGTYLLLCASVL